MKVRRAAGYTLATWFGCGLSPVAPGTVGTVGALPVYFALERLFGIDGARFRLCLLGVGIAITAIGIWASNVVVADAKEKDPQRIVIDEVAGVLFTLVAAPVTSRGVVAAVVLFRVFDMTKPFPARRLEHLPAGWGVVMDDVAAAAWAALFLVGLSALGVLA